MMDLGAPEDLDSNLWLVEFYCGDVYDQQIDQEKYRRINPKVQVWGMKKVLNYFETKGGFLSRIPLMSILP